jgi:TonB family protein
MKTGLFLGLSMVLSLIVSVQMRAALDANNKLFVFHGKIRAVDTAARVFTLQTNKQNYVFVITDQTMITRNGKAQQFADLKPGQPAEVEMQIGRGDKGMAVSVRLIRNSYQLDYRVRELQLQSQLQSLFAATTPSEKTISGTELSRLVVHKPRFEPIWHGPSYGPSTRLDVFLLSVRPDGTVSNVEVLRATGYDMLDKPTTEWITKWRFRPNSVVQVRVPIQLVRSRY